MKSISCGVVFCSCLAVWIVGTLPASAQVFVVDGPTAGSMGVAPDDVLLAPGGPLLMPGASGLPVGPPPPPPPVDVDALSFSHIFAGRRTIAGVEFSVAPGSMGAPGSAVATELAGDESADIFGSALGGTNIQLWDGDGIPALGAALPLGVPEPGGNTNGWDGHPPFGPPSDPGFYYSISPADAAGHPLYGPIPTSPADVFFSPPVPGYSVTPALYASAAALGLAFADDIDGLTIVRDSSAVFPASELIFFSLSPGSPTLGLLTASPADVLVTSIGGSPVIAFASGSLGLLPSDDVDALDLRFVPEPSCLALAAIGLAFGVMRRRR